MSLIFDRSAHPASELNTRQRLTVIVMDVAVLAEVTVSIYMASRDPDNYTIVFMKAFFTMLLPTVIAGLVAIRRFRERPTETSEKATA
ncbi:hypothetical protein DFW101_2355 [Solidesulfovibrio carbinoliphilus subsp. oakridgensis]|uniref:Uncharacterized protein n=1 Tax=Solidesulfovibrio carbinoliphilus subsp. oakridgensis TaxID=694327 RepID=G7QB18_9BACT|nr:hypothetical protein [Solidesulfovibrio carbinoliphilus]EHJ48359.1 hypothetical protein DFW101_2355 [Solidesulfovibrio carbinoliphilus subsp. oakridgensis]